MNKPTQPTPMPAAHALREDFRDTTGRTGRDGIWPRRRALSGLAALAASTALPAQAQAQAQAQSRALPPMTDGPFYPPERWRAQWTDWDADLTRVQHRTGSAVAQGELLGLDGEVVDNRGRRIDGAQVEIWQCDALAAYHHPRVRLEPGQHDPGFAGFGATKSGADGAYRFRTIKPVPYPGRTPHIHVKLRHASFGELTSQLFLTGDPGNARDFLWRQLDEAAQAAAALVLQPAPAGSGLRWVSRHRLVVPA
jgi:protocatechuate 3,4-dioxygenase, beta subunit